MEKLSYSILVEIDRCIGCYACEVSCKQEHNLENGYSWIRMIDVGPVEKDGILRRDFVPTLCMHCGSPRCVEVCPSRAISKEVNGMVFIHPELCIGCKLCLTACPISAIQFNPEKEVAEKCNLCIDRIDKGLEPSCVRNCPTEALHFGETNKILDKIRKRKINIIFSFGNQVLYSSSGIER